MWSIVFIVLAGLAMGGLLAAFCFDFSCSGNHSEANCREDCTVCPERGRCESVKTRDAELHNTAH